MKHSVLIPFTCFLFALFFFQCKQELSEKSSSTISDVRSSGTLAMIDSLELIYKKTNFRNHPYASTERLRVLETQLKQVASANDPNIQLQLATSLLRAGKNEEAISIFEKLLQTYPVLKEVNAQTKKFYDIYAITLMRKGEVDNCIENHSAESCLLPIQGKGIHINKTGSQKAISVYEKILKQFPEDLQSRWLLNTAYMTLGEHPANVPAEYLIPTAAYESDYNLPKFENVAMGLGLDVDGLAGGCVIGDFNNDGFLDIMASSWGMKDQIRLFINKGDGSFEDATEKAGLMGITGGLNMNQTDYNNDGFLDIYLMRGAWNPKLEMGIQPNSLIRNNGDGTFSDVTIEAGLYNRTPTQSSTWFDYNNDGHLDLFVGNETIKAMQNYESFPCNFFHNNGDGTFKDIAVELGMDQLTYVKGVASADINNDGLIDVYISNLDGENNLYLNQGQQEDGQWAFKDIAENAGVQEPLLSFPCWFFDFNNDGLEDIFVSAFDQLAFSNQSGELAADYLDQPFQSDYPRLYLNNGDLTFKDITEQTTMDRAVHTMGCNYGDIDNDGFLDFYLGTGAPDYRAIVPNRMFRNDNGKKIQDITTAGGFGHIQKGHGISFGDLDNDGDSDVYAVMGGSFSGDNFPNALFENPGNDNRWITLLIVGQKANKMAMGAKVRLVLEMADGQEKLIYRTVSNGASFGGNSLQLEIGLGMAKRIKSVEVNWPNDENQFVDYGTVALNQKIKIIEGQNKPEVLNSPKITFKKDMEHHHHHH